MIAGKVQVATGFNQIDLWRKGRATFGSEPVREYSNAARIIGRRGYRLSQSQNQPLRAGKPFNLGIDKDKMGQTLL